MATEGPRVPAGVPINAALGEKGIVDWRWLTYFRGFRDAIDVATQRPAPSVSLTGQTAAISTTAIPSGSLSAGLYRVGAVTRVTTPDGVSSSVTVTISWTRNAVAVSQALSANASDATGVVVSEAVALIHIDGATPVSYAAAYVSNTAAKMTYELDVSLERIEA